MFDLSSISYRNIKSGREGLFSKIMKPDFISRNSKVIDQALKFANSIEDCKCILVKKHPASGDMDFAWRVYKAHYRLYVYYGIGLYKDFNLA